MMESEMRGLRERLWIKTDIGGCARYERDYFHQVERERIEQVPGNPWVICTLWHAQHAIARAMTIGGAAGGAAVHGMGGGAGV